MLKLALISPFPPTVGGMAALAENIYKSLECQDVLVTPINTHPLIGRIYIPLRIKRILQWVGFIINLWKARSCDAAIIISSSGDYFYKKVLPALYFCQLFKCKVILDFVGGGLLEFSEKEKTRLLSKLRRFDHIIAPSTPFKVLFDQENLRCSLFPHIVDITKFHPQEKNIKEPIFLSAKNLEDYSNIESIIKAFSLITFQFPKARLIITGQGPQKKYLEKTVAELKLDNVEFLSGISYERIIDILGISTILLHATRIESFGIVIIEALASGTPVISTNVGGIPDIIKNGENGYLVPFNDHIQMASKAIELLNNSSEYKKFVEEGLKTAQFYSIAYLGPKLKSLLENVVFNK